MEVLLDLDKQPLFNKESNVLFFPKTNESKRLVFISESETLGRNGLFNNNIISNKIKFYYSPIKFKTKNFNYVIEDRQEIVDISKKLNLTPTRNLKRKYNTIIDFSKITTLASKKFKTLKLKEDFLKDLIREFEKLDGKPYLFIFIGKDYQYTKSYLKAYLNLVEETGKSPAKQVFLYTIDGDSILHAIKIIDYDSPKFVLNEARIKSAFNKIRGYHSKPPVDEDSSLSNLEKEIRVVNPNVKPNEVKLLSSAIEKGILKLDNVKQEELKLSLIKAFMVASSPENVSKELISYDKGSFEKLAKQHEKNISEFLSKYKEESFKPSVLVNDKEDPLKVKTYKISETRTQYREKLLKKDILKVMNSLASDKDLPLFLNGDYTIEHKDDGLNIYDVYTFTLETVEGKKFDIKVNIPTLIEGKYYMIEGNKYIMYNQILAKPILKVKPDTVAISTLYNKNFVYRQGTDSKNSKLNKLISVLIKKGKSISRLSSGNKKEIRIKYSNYEIEKLATVFDSIKLKNGIEINFNKEDYPLEKELEEIGVEPKTGERLAINKEGIVFVIDNTDFVKTTNQNLVDYIVDNISIDKKSIYNTPPKNYHSQINIVGRKIPLIIALMTRYSLKTIMDTYKTNYSVLPLDDTTYKKSTDNYIVIPLSDSKLVIDTISTVEQLLYNPLNKFTKGISKEYSLSDLFSNTKAFPVYETLQVNIIRGIRTSLNKMIDPITKELLLKDALPTDVLEVLLHVNTLLRDNKFKRPNDFSGYRIRNEETFVAMLYRELSNAIAKQANLYKVNKRSYKVSISPDFIMRNMITDLPNVSPLSSSNPYYEHDELNKATFSGFLGLNSSRSSVMDLRYPHKTQQGIIDVNAQVDNAKVGLIKYMALNGNVKDLRGNIDSLDSDTVTKDPTTGLSLSNSLDPTVAATADSSRVAMNSIQARHLLPLDGQYDKPLVRTGMEDALAETLSEDWVLRVPFDCKVISIDEKNKKVKVKNLKTGKASLLPFTDKVLRNSSAGFYHQHSFHLDKTIKVGKVLKKGDKLALNDGVFKDNDITIAGKLMRVTLVPSAELIEDAAILSSEMAEKLQVKLVMDKEVIINQTQELKKCVRIGDKVDINDDLVQFDLKSELDDISHEFSDINPVYNSVKSKWKGEVVDIKVYYNIDEEELSKEAIDLINYLKAVDRKLSVTDSKEKRVFFVEGDRILGRKILNGFVIKIFIKTSKKGHSGSKLTMQSTKAVYNVKPVELMPRTISDDRPLDLMISSFSLITRMTNNNIIMGYMNKLVYTLVERAKSRNDSGDEIKKTFVGLVTILLSSKAKGDRKVKELLKNEINRINSLPSSKVKKMVNSGDWYINIKPFSQPNIKDLINASEAFDVPLEEKIYFPDNNNMVPEKPVPVLYIHIKILNQLATKKISQSHKVDEVNAETGQLTNKVKVRQFSVDESLNLFSYNLDESVLPEFTLFRADDREAFNSMERTIIEKGSVSKSDISTSGQAQTANSLSSYLLAAGYKNNIATDAKVKINGRTVDSRNY